MVLGKKARSFGEVEDEVGSQQGVQLVQSYYRKVTATFHSLLRGNG